MSIRITITDDHPVVRDGLEKMLKRERTVTIIGIYANGAELLNGLKTQTPDIVLLDLQMPDIPGNELVTILAQKHPTVKPIMLTSNDNPFQVQAVMAAGAKGYLLKSSSKEELLTAIKTVAENDTYISGEIKEILVASALKGDTADIKKKALSQREQEILQLIVDEKSSPEIAELLHLSLRTVDNYRQGLMKKLEVHNSAGLIKKALLMGLVRV